MIGILRLNLPLNWKREAIVVSEEVKTHVHVIKRNGERQAFLSSKIKTGIVKSCEKRPVSIEQIDEMVSNIEQKVQNYPKKEIESSKLGEMVMEELEKVDKVAYIRFASVYKQFEDISKFEEFIKKLADDMKN